VAALLLAVGSVLAIRFLLRADVLTDRTLAICNANRHVGLALLLSGQYLHAKAALPAVAAYALVLARAAGLDEHECATVERVALYHDIGKINAALFDIVHDNEKLSDKERALIITHPQLGADVIRPLNAFYPELYDGVLSHHERWDGSGYPRGLKGVDIPPQARIVAFADTFDVITHGRRYERERSVHVAHDAIAGGRGTQFDPELTDLLLSGPVFDEIVETFHAANAPKIVRPDRRDASAAVGAPDITFRWRNGATAQPPRGRPR